MEIGNKVIIKIDNHPTFQKDDEVLIIGKSIYDNSWLAIKNGIEDFINEEDVNYSKISSS